MVIAAAVISSRLFFISSLTYRSLSHPMSASISSAAGDAPGRRVIFIDVVSDTWVLSGVLILWWMTTPVPPSHVVFGANVTVCCIADEYHLRIWPWCYIGKLRLESALATAETRFSHLTFDVRWRPYELNPNLPKGKGHDKMEYYNSKFGPAMVQSMIPRMKEVAQEYGILMEYGGNVGNTLDSHVRRVSTSSEVSFSLMNKSIYSMRLKSHLSPLFFRFSAWYGRLVRWE